MDSSLDLYQRKLKEAITLVPVMDFNSQLAAVEFWNNTSSELQKIVHKSSPNYNQSIVSGDDENFNSMQYMVADRCTSSTTTECSQNGSEVITTNLPLATTNTTTTTLPLANSSSVVNQQYSPDKSYYENIYQETSDRPEHTFENKLDPNSFIRETTDNYATVSNETSSCSLNSLQLNSSNPLIAQSNLNNPQSNSIFDPLKRCEIDRSVSDQQVENSIVDIAADILASETYCPSLDEATKNSTGHSAHTNNEIAPPGELDKMERLIIDSGEEFNNVVTIASSFSCQLPSNVIGAANHESLKPFEVPVEYIDYNVHAQEMSINLNSSIHCINNQLSIQSNQPSDRIQSNFSNQTQCSGMTGNSLFSCSQCNQQFESLQELDHHEKLHLQEADSSFSTIEEAYLNSLEVKREVLGDGGGGDVDNLINNSSQHNCDICHKSFSSAGNLKRHKRAHSGIKPYKCDHCDSAFTEKKSLVIHLRRHTGERPYKCDICGKLFSQSGVLNSHMALHLDERKFECSKCNKTFRQKSQLKLHLMRHDGVKRLECSTCMARFLVKADLTRHIRIHTGQRSFACEICDKMFTRKQSLNEHISRHTGAKPFYSLENSHEANSPDGKPSSS